MLHLSNETKYKVCRRKTARLVELIFDFYKISNSRVEIFVIGAKKMQRLNREFRGIDKTTDVLSFPAAKIPMPKHNTEQLEPNLLGEIFINIDEVRQINKYQEIFQALYTNDKGRRSQLYIFYFLLAHGLLHLIGYQDKTEKDRQAMILLGEKFLLHFFSPNIFSKKVIK